MKANFLILGIVVLFSFFLVGPIRADAYMSWPIYTEIPDGILSYRTVLVRCSVACTSPDPIACNNAQAAILPPGPCITLEDTLWAGGANLWLWQWTPPDEEQRYAVSTAFDTYNTLNGDGVYEAGLGVCTMWDDNGHAVGPSTSLVDVAPNGCTDINGAPIPCDTVNVVSGVQDMYGVAIPFGGILINPQLWGQVPTTCCRWGAADSPGQCPPPPPPNLGFTWQGGNGTDTFTYQMVANEDPNIEVKFDLSNQGAYYSSLNVTGCVKDSVAGIDPNEVTGDCPPAKLDADRDPNDVANFEYKGFPMQVPAGWWSI
jgi:hypothetical protein